MTTDQGTSRPQPSYLRNPHPHGELIAFTAEDDVWVAPLDGGRAWRVSADNMPVGRPRIDPHGRWIAWTSTRDGAPEVHLAPLDGGPARRLTYWGNGRTAVRAWTPDGELVVTSSEGLPSLRRPWARRLPLDGGPFTTLPYGPVGDLAYGPGGAVLLQSVTMGREAAYWKGYRGGTTGKLWLDPDGGGRFHRVHQDLDGNIECPMWVGGRIAFLSDHEGHGAVYSSLPDGSDLRRHSPLGEFYARHAATDGTRVAYVAGGRIHLLDDLGVAGSAQPAEAGGAGDGAGPRVLDIRLGGQRTDLQPHPVRAAAYLGEARPDHTGRGSAVEIRGTTHWVTHRGGPARALAARDGVRTRSPRVFQQGSDQYVVWVTDAEGEDALEIAPATGLAAGLATATATATGAVPAAGTPAGAATAADTDSGAGTGAAAGAAEGDATGAAAGTTADDATGTTADGATGTTADLGAGSPEAAATEDTPSEGTGTEGTGAATEGDGTDTGTATGTAPGTAPRRLAAGRLGRVHEMEVSPDGHRIAVASHDGRVLLVEAQTGEVREVVAADAGDAGGLAFSPDSGWLAWSHPGPGGLRQIKLANTADLTVLDATPLRFQDYAPAFTADGRHLAFLSKRAFDPVYDAHAFDLSFPNACRPYLITLAATTPSPFGPQRHGRPYEPEDEDYDGDGGGGPDDGDSAEGTGASGGGSGGAPAGPGGSSGTAGPHGDRDGARPRPTRVDAEGIADRIVAFPVEAGHYSGLRAAKGGVLWLRHPLTGTLGTSLATPEAQPPGTLLERYDLAHLRVEEITDDADDFAVTGDGSKVLVTSGNRLRITPADAKADSSDYSDATTVIDLGRVRVTVRPAAEWRQMFDETHRLARDHFWRPDMGGVDWAAAGARYRPLLDAVATHDDLVDLLWELHGELRTSHAYVTSPGGYRDPLHRQGLLGADLSRDADGLWRVTRVLPGESSDPAARSPLAAPGVAVRAGDAILAVDGLPVDPLTGPGPLLTGTANKPVELTVAPAGGGAVRHVVAVPLADEEALRYHDWVAGRRAHVHEVSGGRIGYLHVPDMVSSGWAQLHRDLRVEVAREGLVVDVRENRGGHTSQLVVEKLARRIVGWDLPRHGLPMSYPLDAPRGPVVAVADEFAGSDGDIVSAAVRTLGIGPVVGTRTWGGVIGIDSRYELVDGTGVTQPKYSFWLEGYGWDVENHGVDPDVEVVPTPQDWAAGRDPQLDKAVELALAALTEHPAATPPELPPPA